MSEKPNNSWKIRRFYLYLRKRRNTMMTDEQKERIVIAIASAILLGGIFGFLFGILIGIYL